MPLTPETGASRPRRTSLLLLLPFALALLAGTRAGAQEDDASAEDSSSDDFAAEDTTSDDFAVEDDASFAEPDDLPPADRAAEADFDRGAASAAAEPAPNLPPADWKVGPTTGNLGQRAEVDVPSGYRFTGSKDTKKLMEMMGNPTSGKEMGFLAPLDLGWFVVFEFDESGYVKDDEKDKLDADAILKSIKAGNEAANEERRKRGWSTIDIVGWQVPPRYNPDTNNLEWAILGKSGNDMVVNYNLRLLGRRGVMEAALVIGPDELDIILPTFRNLIDGYAYKEGERYAEFREGDKIAKYGLAALVTGGAAAVALKTGLLQKFGKLIVVGFLAIIAFVKKLAGAIFGGKNLNETRRPGVTRR